MIESSPPGDLALSVLGAPLRRPQSYAWSWLGIPVEPIADPVLRHMPTEWPDWREYDAMTRFPLIADPWRQLTSAVLEEPFEILEGMPGGKSTRSSRRLRKGAEWLWAQMGHGVGRPDPRPTLLRQLADVSLYGWRPCQVLPEKREGGRWAPAKVIPNDPWHFRFSYSGTRRLLYLPLEWSNEYKAFSEIDTSIGWITPSAGDLLSNYGRGLGATLWTPYRVALVVSKHFYPAVGRQFGMMKVKMAQSASTAPLTEVIESIRADIALAVEYLNNQNVLIEGGQFVLEWLDQMQFIESGIKLIEHLATGLRIMIQGGHLTSATVGAGPVGSSATQERRLYAYQGQLLAESIEGPISALLSTWLWVNEGVELDPEDLPHFVSRFRLRPDGADIDRLFAMGATFRGRRLAELFGAGSLVASDEELAQEPDEIPLKKTGVKLGDLLAGDAQASPPSTPPQTPGDPGRPTDPGKPPAGDMMDPEDMGMSPGPMHSEEA